MLARMLKNSYKLLVKMQNDAAARESWLEVPQKQQDQNKPMIGHVCLWLYPEEYRVETCYTPMFALLFGILKKVELMFIKHEWMKKMSWVHMSVC